MENSVVNVCVQISGHATSAKYLGFYIMFSSWQLQDCPPSNTKFTGPGLEMILSSLENSMLVSGNAKHSSKTC